MKKVAALVIVLCIGSSVVLIAAGPENAKNGKAAPVVYAVSYNVADLPVWRNRVIPEFAPEVLVKYLRSTVDPASWEAGAEIRPFKAKAILIIAQTQPNHEKIADALASFRENDPREFNERKGVKR
jgi:hypothetical protein